MQLDGPSPEEIAALIDPTGFAAMSRERRKAAIIKAKNIQALYGDWGGWTRIKEAPKESDALLLANATVTLVGHWDFDWEEWRIGQRYAVTRADAFPVPTHFRNIGRLPSASEIRYQ